MPLRATPSFAPVAERMFEIAQPGIGGLNLKDLEYEQEPNQSPYMMNMMYRNGAFSKRYGQEVHETFSDTVYDAIYYKDHLIVHCGTKIYQDDEDHQVATSIAEKKGLFCLYNQKLYYICGSIYEYDGTTWGEITPYAPTIVINRHPDPTDNAGDPIEPYNMVGTAFKNNFDGDGSSTAFTLTDSDLAETTPTAVVNNEEWTYDDNLSAAKTFKIDYSTGVVTFVSAPSVGDNNVEITAYIKKDTEWTTWNNRILKSKYYATFGGNNNSRLFLGGNGESFAIYSEVYDATYFPYTNYLRVGNGAEDITGFGQQYNIMAIFKPNEIYSLQYYINTESTTTVDSQVGLGAFSSMSVNNAIGCDCPGTIQLINSQLVWLNSKYGVCTLASTNIQDERNVRLLSRNIDHNVFSELEGLLDWSNIDKTVSVDFDGKYFLAHPTTGKCYVWDYTLTPYYNSGRVESDAKRLEWYLFDNFYVDQFIPQAKELIYISSNSNFAGSLIKLNEGFADLDFNLDGNADGINAFYMTPFLQFGAVAYLKNVKNIYVQCRGDTSSIIDMYYYTEESTVPEHETDSIRIGGRLWNRFQYDNFQWLMVNWANTFRRKCSLKKIQMASFYFENKDKYILNDTVLDNVTIDGAYDDFDEITPTNGHYYFVDGSFYLYKDSEYNEIEYISVADRDMSISHIALQYSIVKNIK